jgi:ABC-type sugar transport system ATPase subunit
MVLVGPSGCGKSTTLRMIAGLEEASAGTIRIGTRDVTRLEPRERNVAMVFQNYALYPHKTVHENLAFGLKMRGVGKAEIGIRVRRAAEMLKIEALLARKPRQLSGGRCSGVARDERSCAARQTFPFRRAACPTGREVARAYAGRDRPLHREVARP